MASLLAIPVTICIETDAERGGGRRKRAIAFAMQYNGK
jgi:hypothetical protein